MVIGWMDAGNGFEFKKQTWQNRFPFPPICSRLRAVAAAAGVFVHLSCF